MSDRVLESIYLDLPRYAHHYLVLQLLPLLYISQFENPPLMIQGPFDLHFGEWLILGYSYISFPLFGWLIV